MPGAVTDIYGRTTDTIVLDFKTTSLDEYGNIKVAVSGLDSTEQYIVHLRDQDNKIRESVIRGAYRKQITFSRLPVRTYNIHLIRDENRDGKWTTGDYWEGRQPELLKKFELEKLRENWDLEANISWDEMIVDTMGSGIDSSFIQLDSLGQPIDIDIKDKSKTPERRKTGNESNNNKGIRGRRG